MQKILPALAILAATVFVALPSSVNAASPTKGGAETDQSAMVSTDISAHRRRYRYRTYPRFVRGWGYARPYHYGRYYAPNYAYTYPYRTGYWGGPRIFPFGPWW